MKRARFISIEDESEDQILSFALQKNDTDIQKEWDLKLIEILYVMYM